MTTNARDLMAQVVAAQKRAAAGDAAATAELAAAARGRTTGATTAPTPPPPPVSAPTGLTVKDRAIARPSGEIYHVRKMGDHDDVAMMRECRNRNIPVLLYGQPGCGKTALFEASFTIDGFEFLPGDGDTAVADLVGGYVQIPGGGFLWVDGPLPRAMERGVPFLIDEAALIDPKVMAVAYSVMDGRSVLRITSNPERDDVISQPGFVVFGACNPSAPGANMSEALISRFKLHVEMGVDFQLMRKMGVNPKLITCVQNMKTKFDTTHDIGYYPAIREMLSFMEIEKTFGLDVALQNIVSQAPENDRAMIADILTRGFAQPVKALAIK